MSPRYQQSCHPFDLSIRALDAAVQCIVTARPVKADVRRRMSPAQRQSVARISEGLGIHVVTLQS